MFTRQLLNHPQNFFIDKSPFQMNKKRYLSLKFKRNDSHQAINSTNAFAVIAKIPSALNTKQTAYASHNARLLQNKNKHPTI